MDMMNMNSAAQMAQPDTSFEEEYEEEEYEEEPPRPSPEQIAMLINSIGDFKHDGKGTQDTCVICLERLKKGEMVKVLPGCTHRFHSKCINKWLKECQKCPLCKDDLFQ